MQIDWGWGACLCTHTSTRGGTGRLNSHTLPMSHSLSLLHTHTHKHAHLWTKGWGLESRHNLSHTQSALSDSDTDQSWPLSLSPVLLSPLLWKEVFSNFFLLFPSSPSQHHGLWIPAYLPLCRMFSGSRNVYSGPPIWLVGVGRQPGVKQVPSWDWHPWNHETKSR